MKLSTELKLISENCGLPNEFLEQELIHLVKNSGEDPQTVGLEKIREIMTEFLQDVFTDLLEDSKQSKNG